MMMTLKEILTMIMISKVTAMEISEAVILKIMMILIFRVIRGEGY